MRIPFLSSLFFFKRSEEENVSRVYKTRQDEVWNVINDRDPSIQKSTVLTLDTLSFSHFHTCTHTHTRSFTFSPSFVHSFVFCILDNRKNGAWVIRPSLLTRRYTSCTRITVPL